MMSSRIVFTYALLSLAVCRSQTVSSRLGDTMNNGTGAQDADTTARHTGDAATLSSVDNELTTRDSKLHGTTRTERNPDLPGSEPIWAMNLTTFERTVDEYLLMTGWDPADASHECLVRSHLEREYFNFTTENGEKYCPSFFDQISCWHASHPGLVKMQCPEFFRGVIYDKTGMATRTCLSDGIWGNKNMSDYSGCRALRPDMVEDSTVHVNRIILIHNICYSISFLTTLGALAILFCCKTLWCVRNYIHMNFLSSFLLLYIIFFIVLLTTEAKRDRGDVDSTHCFVSEICLMSPTLANFCWMFVEGVYLYSTVVAGHVVRLRTFWLYAAMGWGVPVMLTVIYVVVRLFTELDQSRNGCLDIGHAAYIISVPIILIILVNIYFMVRIIIVIVRRPGSSNPSEMHLYKKGCRALLVLIPLLGAAYLLFLIEPTPDQPTVFTYIYRYVLAILQSTQGFFVALIYVFLSPEVHNIVKRRVAKWREDATLITNISRKESKPQLSGLGPWKHDDPDEKEEEKRREKTKSISEGTSGTQPGEPAESREELVPLQTQQIATDDNGNSKYITADHHPYDTEIIALMNQPASAHDGRGNNGDLCSAHV